MKRRLSLAVALLAISGLVSAQVPECSDTQARAAEAGIDRLKTWTDLHAAFKKFHFCDDGGIAEGWDDFVARMLARRWNKLSELHKLSAVDTRFRAFVIRHISNTADGDDLDLARVNAREHCPKSAQRLCADIAAAMKK